MTMESIIQQAPLVTLEFGLQSVESNLWRYIRCAGDKGAATADEWSYTFLRAGSVIGVSAYVEDLGGNAQRFRTQLWDRSIPANVNLPFLLVGAGVRSGFLDWAPGIYEFVAGDRLRMMQRKLIVGGMPQAQNMAVVVYLQLDVS